MNLILRNKYSLLLLIAIGTVLFAIGITSLRINFSFEDFYTKDDEEFVYYAAFQDLFYEDQNYMIYLALQSPSEDIFDLDFLQKSDAVFEQIGALAGIDSLISGTRFPQIKRRGLSFSSQPYLQFESEEAIAASQDRISEDSSMIGLFITRDKQYICGYVFIDQEIFDKRERDYLSEKILSTLDESGYEYIVSGIPFIRTRYVEVIGQELAIFLSLSVVLILSILFLTYRNFWGVMIPTAAILISLVWILGLMGATGKSINLISNLMIPIIFVVGTSDVVHLITKYLRQVRSGISREEAMQVTLKEIGMALFLTSLTTSIGFASLLISRIPPIRDFGLYAAMGVMFTFLISIVLLPNALLYFRPDHFIQPKSLDANPVWDRWMDAIYEFTKHHAKLIALAFAGILIASGILIFYIPTDTYLIEDIGKNDPIRKSMEFFEEQSYGLRPFEMGIHVKQEGQQITDQAILVEIDKMEKWLDAQVDFSPFLSPASIVREANYLSHFSRERHRRIPQKQEEIDELLGLAQINGGQELIRRVVSEDGKTGRISSRIPDMGTDAFQTLYTRLDSFVQVSCDTTLFRYRATGHAYLTEHNLQYIRRSLLGGLGIAFVIVGIIMGLLFRSWKILLISMLPNVIPLILTGGVMGLFGITLTASTALVFVIAFGIAVDDTIHFLTRYRLEMQKGNSIEEAIRNTLHGTGKAMMITSLILMSGFAILLTSSFGGTWATGMFTALTIVFALLADLVLLPILLRWSHSTKTDS
ncbi:MAG: MMPL family transporter [Bacteroidota bacterium]